jgi:hypothetical protein
MPPQESLLDEGGYGEGRPIGEVYLDDGEDRGEGDLPRRVNPTREIDRRIDSSRRPPLEGLKYPEGLTEERFTSTRERRRALEEPEDLRQGRER